MVIGNKIFHRANDTIGLFIITGAEIAGGFSLLGIAHTLPGGVAAERLEAEIFITLVGFATEGENFCKVVAGNFEHIGSLHQIAGSFILVGDRVAGIERLGGLQIFRKMIFVVDYYVLHKDPAVTRRLLPPSHQSIAGFQRLEEFDVLERHEPVPQAVHAVVIVETVDRFPGNIRADVIELR